NRRDTFSSLVAEINSYRYLQYETRLSNRGVEFSTETGTTNFEATKNKGTPYFSDLKIACGHFTSSTHEMAKIETRVLPSHYHSEESALAFIAQARGDSMVGGSKP